MRGGACEQPREPGALAVLLLELGGLRGDVGTASASPRSLRQPACALQPLLRWKTRLGGGKVASRRGKPLLARENLPRRGGKFYPAAPPPRPRPRWPRPRFHHVHYAPAVIPSPGRAGVNSARDPSGGISLLPWQGRNAREIPRPGKAGPRNDLVMGAPRTARLKRGLCVPALPGSPARFSTPTATEGSWAALPSESLPQVCSGLDGRQARRFLPC